MEGSLLHPLNPLLGQEVETGMVLRDNEFPYNGLHLQLRQLSDNKGGTVDKSQS